MKRSVPGRVSGQALIELAVSMATLMAIYFGIAWLGRIQDMRLANIAAARQLAFECTVRSRACSEQTDRDLLAGEIRLRAFGSERLGIRSGEHPSSAAPDAQGRALWVDRTGSPLLERFEDVAISVASERFNTPFAFVGSQGDRAFPGAVRLLSDLGGPGRFGLEMGAGLVRAQVQTHISASRAVDGWVHSLTGMPLLLTNHLVVLTDAWNASGPSGSVADSVSTRVDAGARVPLIEPALRAAWLPVRTLAATAGFLGFESSARRFDPYSIDVDVVPADRLGHPSVPAPEPVPDADGSPTTGG